MSLLKLDSIQLGRDADPTKNMSWRQAALGDYRLSVGNANSPISDVITATATGLTLLNPSAVASPITTDNTNKLATTSWIRNYAGNTAIAFTTPSRKDTPAITDNSFQLANTAWVKNYVDSFVADNATITGIYSTAFNSTYTTMEQQTIPLGNDFIVMTITQLNTGNSVLTVGRLTPAGVYTLWASITDATNKILTARICPGGADWVMLAYIRNGVNIPIIMTAISSAGVGTSISVPLQNNTLAAVRLDVSLNAGLGHSLIYYQTNSDAYVGTLTSWVYTHKATVPKPASSTINFVKIIYQNAGTGTSSIFVTIGSSTTGSVGLQAKLVYGIISGTTYTQIGSISSNLSTLTSSDSVYINHIAQNNIDGYTYDNSATSYVYLATFVVNSSDNRSELFAYTICFQNIPGYETQLAYIKDVHSARVIKSSSVIRVANTFGFNSDRYVLSYTCSAGNNNERTVVNGILTNSGFRIIDQTANVASGVSSFIDLNYFYSTTTSTVVDNTYTFAYVLASPIPRYYIDKLAIGQ